MAFRCGLYLWYHNFTNRCGVSFLIERKQALSHSKMSVKHANRSARYAVTLHQTQNWLHNSSGHITTFLVQPMRFAFCSLYHSSLPRLVTNDYLEGENLLRRIQNMWDQFIQPMHPLTLYHSHSGLLIRYITQISVRSLSFFGLSKLELWDSDYRSTA